MKSRVDFIYSDDFIETEPDKYWKKVGKKRNEAVGKLHRQAKGHGQAVAEIVAPGEFAGRVKLQKNLCSRTTDSRIPLTKFRRANRSRSATKRKTCPRTCERLGKTSRQRATTLHGFGFFAAWATVCRISRRQACGYGPLRTIFLSHQTMDGQRLDANLWSVKTSMANNVFISIPARPSLHSACCLGLKPAWERMKLDKDGGTWLQTTLALQ